jgi:hypothetical protein
VNETEKGRRKYVRTHFHSDLEDPKNYDLVLNTGRISYLEAAEIIAEAALLHVKLGRRARRRAA